MSVTPSHTSRATGEGLVWRGSTPCAHTVRGPGISPAEEQDTKVFVCACEDLYGLHAGFIPTDEDWILGRLRISKEALTRSSLLVN